ncbi:MAG: adenine-specific methyltransferase EcoRI family protein [Selenomonadaceae bacterium]|nr:adenine-specific methyltransferase EcoRI family protein [Selenomonadaceae bacterium]
MAKNKNLNDAARAKKDEFYTQIEDIENELNHDDYREFFRGKTILCNCDDPYESEFFKYFAMNFNALELKKLIVTCYAGSPIVQTELNFDTGGVNIHEHRNQHAYKIVIPELFDWNGDGREDLDDIRHYILNHGGCWERLKGNGDFRSAECIELLREADVVVTNPPFSLFREYVAQLMDYRKKFAIIGHQNAITYKEIFPLIKENKIHLGYGFKNAVGFFSAPYEDYAVASDHREGLIRNSGVTWYTNIPLRKHKEELLLDFEYSPEEYPRYDNYDAIEVSKTARIPKDYFGVMGVPITFLDKYNPEQFEILGCTYQYGDCGYHKDGTDWNGLIGGKSTYKRLFIRRRPTNN